jgi:hypothetical protein
MRSTRFGRAGWRSTAASACRRRRSNRYRESLFLRSTRALDLPCAIIATGPFGDVKNYNGRDFYLSWYPDGLLTDSSELAPPDATALPRLPKGDFVAAVLGHLGPYLPWVTELHNAIESVTVEGGWVFAAGRGQLSAASSSLHRRSKYGVARRGTYLSIDTGKYSTAPWLARRVVEEHF